MNLQKEVLNVYKQKFDIVNMKYEGFKKQLAHLINLKCPNSLVDPNNGS